MQQAFNVLVANLRTCMQREGQRSQPPSQSGSLPIRLQFDPSIAVSTHTLLFALGYQTVILSERPGTSPDCQQPPPMLADSLAPTSRVSFILSYDSHVSLSECMHLT